MGWVRGWVWGCGGTGGVAQPGARRDSPERL